MEPGFRPHLNASIRSSCSLGANLGQQDRQWLIPLTEICSGRLEARAGIEPTYEDLQSSAWPLCHRANLEKRAPPSSGLGQDLQAFP